MTFAYEYVHLQVVDIFSFEVPHTTYSTINEITKKKKKRMFMFFFLIRKIFDMLLYVYGIEN